MVKSIKCDIKYRHINHHGLLQKHHIYSKTYTCYSKFKIGVEVNKILKFLKDLLTLIGPIKENILQNQFNKKSCNSKEALHEPSVIAGQFDKILNLYG